MILILLYNSNKNSVALKYLENFYENQNRWNYIGFHERLKNGKCFLYNGKLNWATDYWKVSQIKAFRKLVDESEKITSRSIIDEILRTVTIHKANDVLNVICFNERNVVAISRNEHGS